MKDCVIGIDLGGTQIKGVLVEADSGKMLKSLKIPTDAENPEEWKMAVRTVHNHLQEASDGPVIGVGLAAPGLADADNRSIAFMPGRLVELEGLDWSNYLGEQVFVINDAHAALLAEVGYGAARGLNDVVLLTLGTGVGGAVWANGSLLKGNLGRAGHLGHITVNSSSNVLDITQLPGSLEDAIGNCSVKTRSYGQYEDTRALVKGYACGDPLATLTWLNSVRDLAVSVASLINTFSPDAVVLGGGIAHAGDHLFSPLKRFLSLFEWRPGGYSTPILKAQHNEWSGAIGAAAWMVKNKS